MEESPGIIVHASWSIESTCYYLDRQSVLVFSSKGMAFLPHEQMQHLVAFMSVLSWPILGDHGAKFSVAS